MSFNNSMGGSNTEGAKYQPKFKDCKLEEKGGDKTLRRWITLIGNIVMNAPYGKFLEYFLDYALKRATKNNTTRPAFLDHDMFDLTGSTALGTSPHSKDTGHSLGINSPRSRTSRGEIGDEDEDSQVTEVGEDAEIQEERQKVNRRVHRAKSKQTKADLNLADVRDGKNNTPLTEQQAVDALEEATEYVEDMIALQEAFEQKHRKSPGKSSHRPASSSTAVTRRPSWPPSTQPNPTLLLELSLLRASATSVASRVTRLQTAQARSKL